MYRRASAIVSFFVGRTSGGAGLGYGPGAAIGAALALKGSGKLAVAIQSDGDMLMTSSAIWTAAKHRSPLLMIMHNNQSYYTSEEHGIEVAKFRKRPVENAPIGTHVDDPAIDFAMMAKSFGVNSDGPVRNPADLRALMIHPRRSRESSSMKFAPRPSRRSAMPSNSSMPAP